MSARKHPEDSLVLALACGATAESVARQCGLGEAVVRRKLADERFRRRVVQARGELSARTCGLLTAAGLEAAEALVELARASGPPAVRLAAAKAALVVWMALGTVVNLESKGLYLEQRIDPQRERSPTKGHNV